MAFRRGLEFTWKPIERIAEDSVSNLNTTSGGGSSPPPPSNEILTLAGDPILTLAGDNLVQL